MRSLPMLHKESAVRCEFVSWKLVNSAREVHLKGASKRGQEPLHTEAEDATSLEAVTKQRNEDRDGGHCV
jgi:hypothetical protein